MGQSQCQVRTLLLNINLLQAPQAKVKSFKKPECWIFRGRKCAFHGFLSLCSQQENTNNNWYFKPHLDISYWQNTTKRLGSTFCECLVSVVDSVLEKRYWGWERICRFHFGSIINFLQEKQRSFPFSISRISSSTGSTTVTRPKSGTGQELQGPWRDRRVGCRLWGRTESDTTEVT